MGKLLKLLPLLMILSVSCGGPEDTPVVEEKEPPVLLLDESTLSVTETGAQLTVSFEHAVKCLYMLVESGASKPSVTEVLSKGVTIARSPSTLTLSDLSGNTSYDLFVAAEGEGGRTMKSVGFTTLKAEPKMISNHTMLLFMMGNQTGLESSMDVNLNRVKSVARKVLANNNHIMVFYDRGNYTQLSEILIEDDRTKQVLVEEYNSSQTSSVDPDFMKGVLAKVKERTKSDTYGLVLSSHGGGWIPADMFDLYMAASDTKAAAAPSQRFFGQDGAAYMDIADLSKALADFHTDYILFDACLMASVEALYDLRKNTDYVVASPIEVLSDGFPFSDIIPNLFLESHNLAGVCQNFMDYYSSRSGAISLVKTSELESLAASVKNIVAGSKATKVDATKIQGYEGFNPHIFYDLEQYMQALTSSKALLDPFSEALKKAVLYSEHTSTFMSSYGSRPDESISLGKSCGLSCYIKSDAFPQVYAEYLKTSWAKAVGLE